MASLRLFFRVITTVPLLSGVTSLFVLLTYRVIYFTLLHPSNISSHLTGYYRAFVEKYVYIDYWHAWQKLIGIWKYTLVSYIITEMAFLYPGITDTSSILGWGEISLWQLISGHCVSGHLSLTSDSEICRISSRSLAEKLVITG